MFLCFLPTAQSHALRVNASLFATAHYRFALPPALACALWVLRSALQPRLRSQGAPPAAGQSSIFFWVSVSKYARAVTARFTLNLKCSACIRIAAQLAA